MFNMVLYGRKIVKAITNKRDINIEYGLYQKRIYKMREEEKIIKNNGYYPVEENGYYFKQALENFVRDFAYGDAINHLVDCGYTAERIIRDYKYPLSDEEIRKRVKKRQEENQRKK